MARLARDPEVEALIDTYRAELIAAGHFAENEVTSPARAFLLRIGGPAGWSQLTLEQQRAVSGARESALVTWMITAGHVRASPEFLACGCQRLGRVAAWVHAEFHQQFMRLAADVGFTPKVAELQWWAVPKVADMRGRAMPHALEPEAVAKLLASCDRQRAVGCRDYAIVLLLVRFGLRSVEVAAMQLDDIDWRAGEILVRGKGGRHDRLPLPIDVGEALAGYLQRRPPGESRAVFVGMMPPGGPLTRQAVSSIVSAACSRAGLPRAGAHRLRHTAATRMLAAGCSLAEIGQVLRHEQLRATAIYAKVDYAALRTLALPWPEGGAA